MLGAAVGGGLLAGLLRAVIPFGGILIPLGLGYLIGEAISRATNRKRGTPLRVLAGLGVVLALALQPLVLLLRAPGLDALASFVPLILASGVGIFANPFSLLGVALGIVIAVNRV
jgi:hypothetical protein